MLKHPQLLLVPPLLLFFCFGAGSFFQFDRAVPPITVSQAYEAESQPYPGPAPDLPWPSIGSAAVSVDEVGLLGSFRDDRPRPIASLAKVMTAYVVLRDHPLQRGETGPDIKVDADDVNNYRQELRNGESVVEVKEGETLNELQLLQGLLIPSANNYAGILAKWDSGSVGAFVDAMNAAAADLAMKDTHYDDASGVSATSRSTARDQTLLGVQAMNNPVFAGIVSQKQVDLPIAGTTYNVDSQLDQNGIGGIKTGWTEDAGGCFLFAASWDVEGHPVRIIGAVLGQNVLADAFATSHQLISAVEPNLRLVNVLSANSEAAKLSSAWGKGTSGLATADAGFVLWPGTPVQASLQSSPLLAPVKAWAEVGKLVLTAGNQSQDVGLVAQDSVARPSLKWRLTRLR